MEIKTKLYNYNIEEIRRYGRIEDNTNFNYLLGYIDFTDPNVVSEMIKDAESVEDYFYESQKDITVNLVDYNVKALEQGLDELSLKLKDIEPLKLSKMIAYALGYIDYSGSTV